MISFIAISISFMDWLPVRALSRAFSASAFASLALSALIRVWDEICSSEAVSSSTALACSVAPWLRAMLDSDTWPDPAATCSEATMMLVSDFVDLAGHVA